jgi:hypothetical protein
MHLIETAYLTVEQKETVYQLWNQEYPEQVSYQTPADFDAYLDNLTETTHYLLLSDSGAMEGWAIVFTREGERWFVIILNGKVHGQGKGTLLLNQIKEKVQKLCGWVVNHNRYIKQNGEPYRSPLKFYEKNGFTIDPQTRLETEKLSAVKIVWEQT